MKNIAYLIGMLLILLFLIQSAFAISTTLKDSYQKGETATSEVGGSILKAISINEMQLIRDNHINVPFEGDLKKVGDKYYLWFITPLNEMNYTIKIYNISTYVNGKIQQITYEKNFSVLGNLTDYSIKPGLIVTNKDFEITARLNEDITKEISTQFIEKSSFALKPGENIIKFSISGINESKKFDLGVGKYTIPAYIKISKSNTIINEKNGSEETNTTLDLRELVNIDLFNSTKEEIKQVNNEREKYRCSEYPGKPCAADEKCSIASVPTSDESSCCAQPGVCKKTETKTSKSWIGYIIVAIVIIGIVFAVIKYKKVEGDKNPLETKIKAFENKKP